MLRSFDRLKGYGLGARDGHIGKVDDLWFDDQAWTVRYLVAATGNWLTGRRVLVSPIALGKPDEAEKVWRVELTRSQIEESPAIGEKDPVSRQFESEYFGYYGWTPYWAGPHMWGLEMFPGPVAAQASMPPAEAVHPGGEGSHLRSCREVAGYHIQARDGEIGHVEDYLLDDESWAVRFLVIGTRNWWPSRKVLVVPSWIESVSWPDAKVFVDAWLDDIRDAPTYSPEKIPDAEEEKRLVEYFTQRRRMHSWA